MTETMKDRYAEDVIKRGDDASGDFKHACQRANAGSLAATYHLLDPDGTINLSTQRWKIIEIQWVKESIDGVWTKVHIYLNQFEHFFQELKNNEIALDQCKVLCTELRVRMLSDLEAMNIDDLRNGELGVAVTNIIDINHLKGERWHLFQDTMANAFAQVITENKIAITAGETAILGQSREAALLNNTVSHTKEKITSILNARDITTTLFRTLFPKIYKGISDALEKQTNTINNDLATISLNIWWTSLGLSLANKLIPITDWQLIVGLSEKQHYGILWPRSNGITAIRNSMTACMWAQRENKTFVDFCDRIGRHKTDIIPAHIQSVCRWKKLRDIATGKTTIFNPFVANLLLWWLDRDPLVGISKIIHVTWNPLHKIVNWVNNETENTATHFSIALDITHMEVPTIITLLQIACDIPDDQAINKWNMWVPYALVCDAHDAETIIRLAQWANISATIIGKVTTTGEHKKHTIQWVGIGKSALNF